MVQLGDYPDVFQTAFADRMVRRPESASAQLHIYGQLEARLTESDRVILGGLVEGVWPPAPRIDPWLSRPMRHELGLDLPERRIGLSAHDFAQLLGSRRGHPHACRKSRRRAGRGLALPAPAGSGRRRRALEGSKASGRKLCSLRGRTGPARQGRADPAACTKAAARNAAAQIVGDGDRGLAARSLHDLCKIYLATRPARSRRYAAVGGRSRLGDPRFARRIHANLRHRACQTTLR